VIDVVDEQVQRVNALLQAALDRAPLGRGDNPRNEVEREDALRAFVRAVDVERDAHGEQRTFGRSLATLDLTGRQRVEDLRQRLRTRTWSARAGEHLVEESFRIVLSKGHRG